MLNIPVPKDIAWPGVWDFALQHYLYLPFIIGSLIVLLAWNQYLYAAVIFILPMSLLQSAVTFMLAVIETITFEVVASTPAWLVGSGLLFVVGGLHRINNVRYDVRDQFLSPQLGSALESSQWRDGATYILFGGLLVAAGPTYKNVITTLHSINVQLAELYPWAVYVSFLVVTAASCIVYVRLRQHQLAMAVEGFDLVVLPHGQIIYAESIAQDKTVRREARANSDTPDMPSRHAVVD
jgi:hypothetical protein